MSNQNNHHGITISGYIIGFILAAIFTLLSFYPVMTGMMQNWTVSGKIIYLIGLAIIQIIMQSYYFLHLQNGSDAAWKVWSYILGLTCATITIAGSWWAMQHLNYNMMGGSGRIVTPPLINAQVNPANKVNVTINPVAPKLEVKTPKVEVTAPKAEVVLPKANVTNGSMEITTPAVEVKKPEVKVVNPAIEVKPVDHNVDLVDNADKPVVTTDAIKPVEVKKPDVPQVEVKSTQNTNGAKIVTDSSIKTVEIKSGDQTTQLSTQGKDIVVKKLDNNKIEVSAVPAK